MSLQRFFLEDQVIADEAQKDFPLALSPDDEKHLRVLRLAPGKHIAVVDAASDYFECEIRGFDGSAPVVSIAQHLGAPEARARVTLVQGMAKGEKMDSVIRHATELGVAAFLPLTCERSIVKLDAKKTANRMKRWGAIAKSAAMQSGQPRIPRVFEPASVDVACKKLAQATAVLVCWEEAPETASLTSALQRALEETGADAADAHVAVVVGPEGGLSAREVESLLACNPRSALVSLGPSILRTETAGVVAPALALYELGGLGKRA